jgi:hypothetical protein
MEDLEPLVGPYLIGHLIGPYADHLPERDPALDLEIREALLDALRQKQGTMTDRGLATATGYRLDWVQDVLQLLAFEDRVVLLFRTSGHSFETVVCLPSCWH